MVPIEVTRVWASEPGSMTAVTEGSTVIVDGAGVYGYAVVWALVIVGLVELIKRVWLARSPTKSTRYKRVVALLPVLVGMLSAPVFGPPTLEAFSLQFSPTEALWFGPGAGAAAGWAFSLAKHTIAPMLPAALRETFIALARRAGLVLPARDDDE